MSQKKQSKHFGEHLTLDGYVGESGTLYRILQFVSWKLSLDKKFIIRGTLVDRVKKMPNNPEIVNLNLEELRALPDDTSQRVTAAILLGNQESIPEYFDYEIKNTTIEALAHWKKQRLAGLPWKPRYDQTIQKQAEVFLELREGLRPVFIPKHSEDYCFARVFGYMSKQEGEIRWPKLHGHETDRLEGMEKAILQAETKQEIDSRDHRVVQAMAMWGIVHKKEFKFTYPETVNKTWPQFWDFLDTIN